MKCRLLPVTDFPSVAPLWDDINRAQYRHPLLESRFVASALRHLGTGKEQIVVYGNVEEPDAIAIMVPQRLGVWNTFQPSQSPLGAVILRTHSDAAAMVDAMLAGLPASVQLLSVTQQDPDIVARPADTPRLRTLDYIETARITVASDFADYWAGRGRNLRHNMKRQRNSLERDGIKPRLEILTNPDTMAAGVASYGELESKGWKAEEGTAIHPDNVQGRFYTELLEQYAGTGNAAIYRYYYNEDLTSVDLCVSNATTMVILKTTYDESIRTSSPALLMRQDYFQPLFDQRRIERIEFYGRVMDWHTKWSDEIRSMYHINAYRNTLVARLHARR